SPHNRHRSLSHSLYPAGSRPYPSRSHAQGATQPSRRQPLQEPALAAPVMLDVTVAAPADIAEAQIKFLDVFVVAQAGGAAIQDDPAVFQDIAILRNGQGHGRVLLDQQYGHLGVAIEARDNGKNFLYQHGG